MNNQSDIKNKKNQAKKSTEKIVEARPKNNKEGIQ